MKNFEFEIFDKTPNSRFVKKPESKIFGKKSESKNFGNRCVYDCEKKTVAKILTKSEAKISNKSESKIVLKNPESNDLEKKLNV